MEVISREETLSLVVCHGVYFLSLCSQATILNRASRVGRLPTGVPLRLP